MDPPPSKRTRRTTSFELPATPLPVAVTQSQPSPIFGTQETQETQDTPLGRQPSFPFESPTLFQSPTPNTAIEDEYYYKDYVEQLEVGDGGKSDEEGDEARLFVNINRDELDRYFEHQREVVENNLPHDPDPVYYFSNGQACEVERNFPKVPKNFELPPPKAAKGQPKNFSDVDNPGGWDSYIYTPHFGPDKNYLYHKLPSGATPVPGIGPTRDYNGHKVHYVAWNGDSPNTNGFTPSPEQVETFSRKYVTPETGLFPKERKSCLDTVKLQTLGLTRDRMINGDALFFYQLLLPFHMAEYQDFEDGRKNYYNTATKETGKYMGNHDGYGKQKSPPSLEELIKFDGIIYMHGALGSTHDIKKRWRDHDCLFQTDIAACMSYYRWNEIKRNLKTSDNALNEGKDDASIGHRFEYIYDVMVHNTNYLTKRAGLDLVIDESSWPFAGYGGKMVGDLTGKKIARGGQTVLLMDCDRFRLRGFFHRRAKYKEKLFSTVGQSETYELLSKFVLPNIGEQKIWTVPPHVTADNYFTGDGIFSWVGLHGMGMMGTVARNRLPKGINSIHFHKDMTHGNDKAKLARFIPPITFVKDTPPTFIFPSGTRVQKKFRTVFEGRVAEYDPKEKKYRIKYDGRVDEHLQHEEVRKILLDPETRTETRTRAFRRVHCSFQSTGACNIGSVNSIAKSSFYVAPKERGRKKEKKKWGIEMNQSRELYLGTYGKIDQADGYIQRADIRYTSWKYYHAAMNHAKSLAILVAYDMYKECAEGELLAEWKLEKTLSFNMFQQRLAKQMIRYSAKANKYRGDNKLRGSTQTAVRGRGNTTAMTPLTVTPDYNKRRIRSRGRGCPLKLKNGTWQSSQISMSALAHHKGMGRFCHSLKQYKQHFQSKLSISTSTGKRNKNGRRCYMCGMSATMACGFCRDKNGECIPLCVKKNTCFLDFHSPSMFGLGRNDRNQVLSGDFSKKDWIQASALEEECNEEYVNYLLDLEESDDEEPIMNFV